MITKAAFESLIYEEKCQLVARELNTLASVGGVFIDLKKSFEIVEQHSEEVLNSYYTIITRYYSIARDEVFSQRHEKRDAVAKEDSRARIPRKKQYYPKSLRHTNRWGKLEKEQGEKQAKTSTS